MVATNLSRYVFVGFWKQQEPLVYRVHKSTLLAVVVVVVVVGVVVAVVGREIRHPRHPKQRRNESEIISSETFSVINILQTNNSYFHGETLH